MSEDEENYLEELKKRKEIKKDRIMKQNEEEGHRLKKENKSHF